MASVTVLFNAPQGMTLTLKLYSGTSDTASDSVSATEKTNDKGCYSCTVTDLATGLYRVAIVSGTATIARGYVQHANTTGTEYVGTYISALATDSIDSDAIGTGLATEVWAASTRTLTQSAESIASTVSGSDISIYRGDTATIAITGLGSIASRTKLWFTAKRGIEQADAGAIIQATEAAGLVTLNGGTPTTGQTCTITVDDASAGNITIVLSAAASKALPLFGDGKYDIQVLQTTVSTLATGTFEVTADITQSVT